jgi:hypothetical protein
VIESVTVDVNDIFAPDTEAPRSAISAGITTATTSVRGVRTPGSSVTTTCR